MGNAVLQSLSAARLAPDAGAVPSWFDEHRQRAWDVASALDWPARGVEAWKYTSLHSLAQRSPLPAPAPGSDTAVDAGPGPGLLFVDGHVVGPAADPQLDGVELEPLSRMLARYDERLRFVVAREKDEGLFANLNTALAGDGAWLRIAAGSVVEPWLTLAARGRPHDHDVAWHLAHRIDLGEGASARLIIDVDGAGTASLATLSTRIRVRRGAHLHLVWSSRAGDALSLFASTRIDIDADAQVTMQVVDGGAAPSRHDLAVDLRGERAHVDLGGVFLVEGRRHADLQLALGHRVGNATSDTRWRILANDRARAVFNGHITVAVGADGTDARLSCKSLIGSAQAEVDSKPVLEIHADDVKCAHGATVGQIDEQALFYLRTRGIPMTQARALLQRAFAVEALMAIPGSPAPSQVQSMLDGGAG